MQQIVAALVALILIALPAAAPARPSAPGRSGAQAQVAALQRAWQRAYAEGDDAALQRLVGERFVLTNTTGDVLDRTNAVSHYGTERERVDLVFEDQQVMLYGAAAVATARVREKQAGGREILLRATDTFVRQKGKWRVAASHWTRLPPDVVEADLGDNARERFVGAYRGPQGGLLKVTRRGARFLVTAPKGPPIEFVAVSDNMLVDPAGHVRWLFVGEADEGFRYVVVQGPNGLIELRRT